MLPRTRALLLDALRAGQHIQRTVERHSVATFIDDEDAQLIVERCFESVGEAIRVLDTMKAPELAQITEYRGIIAMRNVIVHQYAAIKPTRIWQTAVDSLPVTIREIQSILDADPE
jgi:uncharacterized protein with HEPN domain